MCSGLSPGREGAVGLGKGLRRADVVPLARDTPGVDGRPRIEPLDEPTRLVGVVSGLQVVAHEPERLARIEVERDPCQRAARLLRLLLEERQPIIAVELDRVVAADPLEIADVVHTEHGSALLPREPPEWGQALAEEVVAREHEQVVIDPGPDDSAGPGRRSRRAWSARRRSRR